VSQYNPKAFVDTESGTQLVQRLNAAFGAVVSCHKGPAPPAYAEAGMVWIDDAATPWRVKRYDGGDWIVEGAIDPATNTFSPYKDGAPLGSMANQDADAVAITGGSIAGIDPLDVADGGTGAADAAGARANLELGSAAVKDTGTGAGDVPTVGDADTLYIAQGKHTIWVPALAMKPWLDAPCGDHADYGGGFDHWVGLPFDAAANEGAMVQIAAPKSWDEGTLAFQIVWAPADAQTGDVAWEVYATARGDGDAPPTAWEMNVASLTDTANGTAGTTHVSPEGGGSITGAAEGDLLNVLVYRNAADAADTYPADAVLKGLRILYGVNAKDDG
jgi:hypothetical protein